MSFDTFFNYSKFIENCIKFISTYECFDSLNFYFDPISTELEIKNNNYNFYNVYHKYPYNIIYNYNLYKIHNTNIFSEYIYNRLHYCKLLPQKRTNFTLFLLYKIGDLILNRPTNKNLRFCWIYSVIIFSNNI